MKNIICISDYQTMNSTNQPNNENAVTYICQECGTISTCILYEEPKDTKYVKYLCHPCQGKPRLKLRLNRDIREFCDEFWNVIEIKEF